MIIDITKSGYQKGYLPKTGVGVFHPFFATANAAFRKQALQQSGGFDPHCATGEDIDLCIRVANAGYEMWFEPSARITHFHRYSLKGLLKQWFHYGFGHAYLFKKHSPRRRLQCYRYDLSDRNDSPFGIRRILDMPFPLYGMIFLSSFHLMHAALLAAIILLLCGFPVAAMVGFIVALAAAGYYFAIRFDFKTPGKSLLFSAIRYIADSAYVLGGFLGGIRQKMIYLEATRSRKRT